MGEVFPGIGTRRFTLPKVSKLAKEKKTLKPPLLSKFCSYGKAYGERKGGLDRVNITLEV
jgi:hypothetical protein